MGPPTSKCWYHLILLILCVSFVPLSNFMFIALLDFCKNEFWPSKLTIFASSESCKVEFHSKIIPGVIFIRIESQFWFGSLPRFIRSFCANFPNRLPTRVSFENFFKIELQDSCNPCLKPFMIIFPHHMPVLKVNFEKTVILGLKGILWASRTLSGVQSFVASNWDTFFELFSSLRSWRSCSP